MLLIFILTGLLIVYVILIELVCAVYFQHVKFFANVGINFVEILRYSFL